MTKNNPLGNLLGNPVPPAAEDPDDDYSAARERAEARKRAEAEAAKSDLLPGPARRRRRKPAREKLTVNISPALWAGLEDLVRRDGRYQYEEVEAALSMYLASKNIPVEKDTD